LEEIEMVVFDFDNTAQLGVI